MRTRRVSLWVGIGLAVVAVLLLAAVLIVTRTDWGRERVRSFALDEIEGAIDGEIEVGRVEGDLLRRVRLIDVAIRDSRGRPFLEADTIETRFGFRALLRQRVELADLRVVNAVVLLDQPPGEEWNYVRIFRLDPETTEPGPRGWGDWVALDDVTVINGRLVVRAEWQPPEEATPAERRAALRRALSGDSREHVVRVPGGYQNLMDFRELNAKLPRVLVAHPDSAGTFARVERLGGLVRPFSPPPARVRDLSGDVRLLRDSLFVSGVRAVLPGSRLTGGAIYALHSGDLLLIARGAPVAFEDLRWLEPRLPERGGGEMLLRLALGQTVNRVVAWDMDVAVGDATVEGRLDLTTGDSVRFGDTDLRFARVETGMVERLLEVDFPRTGRLTGALAVTGRPRALRVDGDIRFDDRAGPSSRVIAQGGLGLDPELRFDRLRLRFAPLHAELARLLVPELPVRGTIEGTALLAGSLASLDLDADLVLRDPRHGRSRVRLAGGLDRGEALRLRDMVVRMDPLRLDLLRADLPELPAGATATGHVTLDGFPSRALSLDGDIVLDDPATGVSDLGVRGGVAFDDELRFDDLRVRMEPLRVDLVRPWIPELPRGGSLTGDVRLDGVPSRFLYVDGNLAHHHEGMGVSRLEASGGIGVAGPLEFRGFDLRMEPLHMALIRPFAPGLPLAGTLSGAATLEGSFASRIGISGDVVHEEQGERSHVTGQVDVVRGPGGWAAVDVRLQPLSLDVAGRFMPAAGLHGAVSGRLRTTGDMGDLRVDADLSVAGGGDIRAEGRLDLAGAAPAYDLDMRLRDFDLAAVTWRAPAETALTGAVTARGRGLEPATMRATIAADLTASAVDGLGADRVRLRAELADGLARVDSSLIRLGGAEALLDGSFGLVAGRDGVLTYQVAVDSLHAFAAWVPGADTAVAAPAEPPLATAAPPTVAAAEDHAKGPEPMVVGAGDDVVATIRRYVARDGARVTVNTTRVQSGIERIDREPARLGPEALAAGGAADSTAMPGVPADAVPPEPAPRPAHRAPADSLAGSLHASGSLRGNVSRFDLDGRAVVDALLYRGAYIGAGEAEYEVADAGTASPDVALDADLRDVRTATIAFDGLSARGRYHGIRGEGQGEAVIVAHGTDDTEYRADAEFALSLDRSELRLADLMVRYDTVTWRTTRPGVVSWAGDAIELASIDIASDGGGRVRLDGRLPVDGSGDLDVLVEDLDFAPVVALLQRDEDVEGRLNLDAHVAGTLDHPRIDGTARLEEARLDGERVPDVRARFQYEGLVLTADATLLHEGRQLATAEARLPVDLSLRRGLTPRLLPGELAIDVRADSLPIESIPRLSEHIDDAHGLVRGDLAVRGTVEDPVVTGAIDLDLGSVRVVPLDLRLEGVAGALRLEGNVVRVDSLVARSGGPVRVTGEIGLGTLTDPTFALAIESNETLVIDTDDIALKVDAELTVGGSLAAIEVGGEVRTRSGVIRIPELSEIGETAVVSLHSPATSGRIEEEFLEDLLDQQRPALLDRARLDVTLRIDRDVWLRSTEANVEIYTSREAGPLRIRMNGPGTSLALEGTLNTDRGEYEFMSRRFDLTRGAATFVPGREINPVLQVAAEHEVRLPGREAFAIRVLLGGTVRDMEITLESTAQPPIAQTELLSYLAFGRDATSLLYREGSSLSAQGGDSGDLVGNVAGLATQQLGTIALNVMLGDLERELMDELGVDVFRITPADLPPDMFTGRYVDLLRSTEVEAGRYFSSRLFVAGQINTGMSRPGVRVEYVGPFGVEWRTSWTSRWLPTEPTLTERDPRRAGVLGSFLLREWRF